MKIVMLTTPTCIKCKSMVPLLEEVSVEYGIDIEIRNALDDDLRNLIEEYNIKSVPYLFFYEGDEIKHVYNGEMSKSEIINLLT